MPPKKKQEQIDLSTLPQCKTINIFLQCKGKKDRASKILGEVDSKNDKLIYHIKKQAVLDYAKQKSIYVDPETLTDKQKKDPKFMESICTQMTPQVLAKATDAYINNQNVKVRLQKKALLDKPQSAEQQKNKKLDCIYIFDDFPNQFPDYEALAAANQAIKFVLVFQPKITWACAPEEPEPAQNNEQQPPQPDQQYEQYKKLKQAENFNEQDINNQKKVESVIHKIKEERKKSPLNSLFRNAVIEYVKCVIDPYAEQKSIQQAANSVLPICLQLLNDASQFSNWVKDKNSLKLPQMKQGQAKDSLNLNESRNQDPTTRVLNEIFNIFEPKNQNGEQNQLVNFDQFDFEKVETKNKKTNQRQNQFSNEDYYLEQDGKAKFNALFINFNQEKQQKKRNFIAEKLKSMRHPGIDRFLMPEIPLKSQGTRKLYRSSFGQFLPPGLNFQDFERKSDIIYLQAAAKEADEQRNYDFSTKIYEEQHKKQSLARELNKALLFDQSSAVLKYNQNNDKLYVCLLYKNPPRRMSKKVWECNWKVLPNLQNWLKYFKQNQSNSSNSHFYDIDYELIGNIQQEANVWSLKDGGLIIRKKINVAGKQTKLLYCLPGQNTGDLKFGLRQKNNSTEFYAKNEIVAISTTQIKKQIRNAQGQSQQVSSKSVILTFEDQTIMQLRQSGDVLVTKKNERPRLITKDGYTIVYLQRNKTTVLHPNGGVTFPPQNYVNLNGRGFVKQKIQQVPTLRRFTENNQLITRREDGTTIIQDGNKRWIKFSDHTNYVHQNETIFIQKQNYPKFTVRSQGKMIIFFDGVLIQSSQSNGKFRYSIKFQRICNSNSSQIRIFGDEVEVFDGRTEKPYVCKLSQPCSISKGWDNQQITVSFSSSKYQQQNGKIVDPEQQQDNFNEEDTLKADYVQPRVFIINNDNTGVQLLSQNQLKYGYFNNFNKNQVLIQDNMESNLYRCQLKNIPNANQPGKEIIHGILPISLPDEMNMNKLKQIPIQLDVYNNTQEINQKRELKQKLMQVRSLIKHEPLTREQRQAIAQVLRKRTQWQAKSEKEDNEFGYKQKNDPSNLERFQLKKKLIQLRKAREEEIIAQRLKAQAIQLYERQTKSRINKIKSNKKQAELRKKLSKKKSYVSQYNWKEPGLLESDQNYQFYNPQAHFYANYFETAQGKKALSQMPEWVFRPKQIKKQQELDPQIRSQLNATMNKTKKQQQLMNATNQRPSVNEQNELNQRYDTVQPQLRPSPQVYIKPSVFTQKQIDEERFAFQTEKKAYEYHERKRKDFDVYGRDRKDRVQVPSLMRTQPVSELNQKYLVTQAPVDKKVKISSMKNKLTSQASNMTQMRKQGPHANLIRTIDKGNDYNRLLEKRTMMVQADLNDKLQRDIQINPIEANFGLIKEGGNYELKIQIKNEDVLAQRVHVKKPKSIFCKVQMQDMGPIALGMTRKITVQLKASNQIIGKFSDQFDIVTKHEIYHIPVSAQILSKNQFQSSGSVLSKTVRQFEEIGRKKRQQLPPIK